MKKEDIEGITWVSAPHLMVYYFAIVLRDLVISTGTEIVEKWRFSVPLLATFGGFILFLQNPPSAFATLAHVIREEGSFALYWVILGVLSSIGLGSGLHTFVLFLGPHVMRVADNAILLGSTAFTGKIVSYFTMPSNGFDVAGLAQAFSPQYAETAWDIIIPSALNSTSSACTSTTGVDGLLETTCNNNNQHASAAATTEVTFLAIVFKVWWACFLWGFGTSLGELPPYFIARAAARAGTALEELTEVAAIEEEMQEEEEEAAAKKSSMKSRSRAGSKSTASTSAPKKQVHHHHPGLVDRAKVWVFECVKQYGFVAILVAASIPNPLFDLAGLTCGTFGVSFWTFFGATFIGKAIVKVSIQAFFIIFVTQYGPVLFESLRGFLPNSFDSMITSYEKNFMKSRHCRCVLESSPDECVLCCDRNFKHVGSTGATDCAALCGAAGTPDAHSCASGSASADGGAGGGAGALVKDLWGYILTMMILWFVASTIKSLVHQHLVKEATTAATTAAAAAATTSAVKPASARKIATALASSSASSSTPRSSASSTSISSPSSSSSASVSSSSMFASTNKARSASFATRTKLIIEAESEDEEEEEEVAPKRAATKKVGSKKGVVASKAGKASGGKKEVNSSSKETTAVKRRK